MNRTLLPLFLMLSVTSLAAGQKLPELPPDPLPDNLLIHELPPGEPEPPPKIWTGELELGLNGASGNSELFNMRSGGKIKRKTEFNQTTMDWIYRYATSSGEETENRALANARSEWPFKESPWNFFVSGSMEYDEFKEFNVRLAGHAGLGYDWINNDTTQFKTRIGFGGSREIGGKSNRFVPEALFGADLEHKISDRQKIVASAEYFPDLEDFSDYRTIAKLSYELLVDPEWNLTFKVGVLDRYDSTPQGKKPNDIEYFAVLLWKF